VLIDSEREIEALDSVAQALRRVAHALAPQDAGPGHDETGGHVESLTEAVMGNTAGLVKIAQAASSAQIRRPIPRRSRRTNDKRGRRAPWRPSDKGVGSASTATAHETAPLASFL